MAMVQHIAFGVGGLISVQPATRPGVANVTVYSGAGSIVVDNQTAQISNINTIITAAVSKRSKSITLDDATGVVEGTRFIITSPTEWVRCKTVSGNAITLWHPLREDHANAVNAHGTLVTYTVGPTNATTKYWDGFARWELDGVPVETGVECTLYGLARVANEQDIYDVHPQFASILAAEADIEGALDAAHDFVLMLLGATGRARAFPASTEFVRATALALARNHYAHQSSDSAERMFTRYSEELEAEVGKIMSTNIPDTNQDGIREEREQRSSTSFKMERR